MAAALLLNYRNWKWNQKFLNIDASAVHCLIGLRFLFGLNNVVNFTWVLQIKTEGVLTAKFDALDIHILLVELQLYNKLFTSFTSDFFSFHNMSLTINFH